MTTLSRTTTAATPGRAYIADRPAGSLRFDRLMNLFSAWIVASLFLDGWYHNTFQDSVESFFTPWHGVLYSGVAAAGAMLAIAFLRNVQRGHRWRSALPVGYSAALAGFVLFALSGLADFAWHTVFGFEFNVEALLSPPHLALAAAMVPLFSAPLRAAWARSRVYERSGWRGLLPALLSLFMVMSVFTFFAQFANAYTHANILASEVSASSDYFRDVTGLASILIPSGIAMAAILLVLRRWALPAGSLTFLLTTNAVLMYLIGIDYSGQQWPVLLAAFASGVTADVLLIRLKPSLNRVGALRAFAFVVPWAASILYFLALIVTGGVVWRIHMWLGVSFLAGVVGLGLSYLLAPPAVPAD